MELSLTYIKKQSEAKKEWAIAGVLSIIYFVIFVIIALNPHLNTLLFGFCVWGSPIEPDDKIGCGDNHDGDHPLNSHMGCFLVGMTAFMIEIGIYFMDKRRNESTSRKLTYLTLAIILAGHGTLHWFIQQISIGHDIPILGNGGIVVNCYRDLEGQRLFILFGTIFFGLWSFVLSMAIIYLGVGKINRTITIISIVLTAIVLWLSFETKLQLILPSLFVMTHVLVSVVGLLAKEPTEEPNSPKWVFQSATVGKFFIFATSAAIVEITLCPEIYKPIGGHVWCDIGLALVALTATPYFSFPSAKGKKD